MVETQSTPAIVARYYDFLLWLKQHVDDFPRNERYTFGQRIENKGIDILENLITACYQRDKLDILRRINCDLEVLRYFFRMCKDLKLLRLPERANIESRLSPVSPVNQAGCPNQKTPGTGW